MGKKPTVSVIHENERIPVKNSLPYLKCMLRLSYVVHGPIYGRFMGFYVNGLGDFKDGAHHCQQGCNNSQHCRDLECIVGRIQPLRLCKLRGDHVKCACAVSTMLVRWLKAQIYTEWTKAPNFAWL